jgi:hypothetical protein
MSWTRFSDLSKSDVPVQVLPDKGLVVVRVALEGCYHRRLPVRPGQPCVLGDVALGHDKNDVACSPIVH